MARCAALLYFGGMCVWLLLKVFVLLQRFLFFFSGTVVVACDVLCVVGVGVRRSATTAVDRF